MARNTKVSFNSTPDEGVTEKVPGSGGSFVTKVMAAVAIAWDTEENRVQDNANCRLVPWGSSADSTTKVDSNDQRFSSNCGDATNPIGLTNETLEIFTSLSADHEQEPALDMLADAVSTIFDPLVVETFVDSTTDEVKIETTGAAGGNTDMLTEALL